MNHANLPELMLLYLADALTEEEHALVKERLTAGDPEATVALRDARELYAALPLALEPVEPGPGALDNLMRQVEADALRGEPASKPKRTKPAARPAPAPEPKPRPTAPPQPLAYDRRPSWVVPAALAAGCAIACSAAVFFLARWDVQQSLDLMTDRADELQIEIDAQEQRLVEQRERLAEQDAELMAQAQAHEAQQALIDQQQRELAAQVQRVTQVARSVAAQEAVTEELRTLFAQQSDELLVLMRHEEEASRVLSLLSAPRLEAYVLAGTPDAPDAAGRMFYDPQTRRLRLTVAGLDTADPGRTYQAWFVLDEGAGAPVSLGTFNTNAAGDAVFETTLADAPDRINLAAVSVEPLGGVPAPTGAIVIAGGAQ